MNLGGNNPLSSGPLFKREGFDQQLGSPLYAEPSIAKSRGSRTVTVHLAQVRAALETFAQSYTQAERHRKHQQSLEWLSKNRRQYAGQWIALQGDKLLATGRTAKQVYSQVLGQQSPPLVVKIDAEDLPFGGW